MAGGVLLFRCFQRFAGFQRGGRSLCGGNIFVDVDATALERREQIVNFFRRVDFGRQNVIHLVEQQVAPLLA